MKQTNNILFPQREEEFKDMVDIGAGFALKKVSQIHIEIYSPNGFYKAVELKTQITKRLLVVELVNKHRVRKSLLAKALEISRQSIDNWLASYQKWGYEGLINSTKPQKNSGRPKRPSGNKARQLEEERRKEQEAIEAIEKENIPLNFPATEGVQKEGLDMDMFNCKHEFEENRYAGSFLYWGIFQHYYRFMEFIESHLGKYALVVYLYAMMQINGLGSIEQLKTVFKREFGRIMGLRKLFSLPVLWELIGSCSQLKVSLKTLASFFLRQAQLGLVCLSQLFIDGHFVPYYGKEDVNKGYYTQRNMMHAGQTVVFVHDIHGEIVHSEIQEGKGDMLSVVKKMNAQWTPYLGGIPPLLIADRELWSVKAFLLLEKQKARFVTWERYTPEGELDSIDDTRFSQSFEMNDIEYGVYETWKIYKDTAENEIQLRRIILWNKKAKKRMAVVSNDGNEDSITIAQAMLNRWGVNENGFKHMGNRINMHYNPVLDLSEESQMQMVQNPVCKELRKKKKELKKEIGKIEKKLIKLTTLTTLAQKTNSTGSVESIESVEKEKNEKNNKSKKSKKNKRNESWKELTTRRDDLLNELKKVDSQLSETPEKIKLSELKEGRSFKLISTEGKNLWDLSQALVWNSRKKLIQEFGRFLSNERDLIPALEAITRCRGWIKSSSKAIIVRLEPLDTKRFRVAQTQLCRALSQKNIRLKNGKQIIYSVADTTENVQKNGAKSNQIKEV